jgi:hypothetical protein
MRRLMRPNVLIFLAAGLARFALPSQAPSVQTGSAGTSTSPHAMVHHSASVEDSLYLIETAAGLFAIAHTTVAHWTTFNIA